METKKELRRILYGFTTSAVLAGLAVSIPSQTAEAASLDQGATVEALDANGEQALPLTSVELSEGDTAEDVFNKAAQAHQTTFDGFNHPEYGLTVEEVGGVKAEGETDYWSLVDNGQYAQKGVSSLEAEHGDNFRFQLLDWTVEAEEVGVSLSALDAEGHYVIEETDLQLQAHSTAHDALNSASSQTGVDVELGVDDRYHAFVKNIGQQALEDDEFWSFTVNGEMADVGISSYRLKPNDQIQFAVQSMNQNPQEDQDQAADSDQSQTSLQGQTQLSQANLSFEKTLAYYDQLDLDLSYGNEWEVVALANLAKEIPASYVDSLSQAVKENEGQLGRLENHKAIIALSLMGKNARDFAGYDLVQEMIDHPTIPTVNGDIYTLLAIDSGPYDVDPAVRQNLIQNILDAELADGGFALFADKASVDVTAMALAALAPYQEQAEVKEAVNRSVQFLSEAQDEAGGYPDRFAGGDSSEAVSQVIIGLSTIGVDPSSEDFTKAGGNLLQHLAKFQNADGSFSHLLGQKSANPISSQQALLAQIAYLQFLNGRSSIYSSKDTLAIGKNHEASKDSAHQEQAKPNKEQATRQEDKGQQTNLEKDLTPAGHQKIKQSPTASAHSDVKKEVSAHTVNRPSLDREAADSTLSSQDSTETLPSTGVGGTAAISIAMISSGLGLAYSKRKQD